jgi:hypothetical protein
MSRSYRKPYIKDVKKRYWKNQANRRVRRSKDVGDGGGYKRYYEQWNIVDYWCYSDEVKWTRK